MKLSVMSMIAAAISIVIVTAIITAIDIDTQMWSIILLCITLHTWNSMMTSSNEIFPRYWSFDVFFSI